jgi:hypothetical protein
MLCMFQVNVTAGMPPLGRFEFNIEEEGRRQFLEASERSVHALDKETSSCAK